MPEKGVRDSAHQRPETDGGNARKRWTRVIEKGMVKGKGSHIALSKGQASAVSTLGFVAGSPVCPLSRSKYEYSTVRFPSAAELPRTIRETAVCKPAGLQAVRAQLWSRRRGGKRPAAAGRKKDGTSTLYEPSRACARRHVPAAASAQVQYLAAGTGTGERRAAGEVAVLARSDGCWVAAQGLSAWPGPGTATAQRHAGQYHGTLHQLRAHTRPSRQSAHNLA
ncbi:hypothetical protein BBK36DRAFT_1207518 [Trichoderma citrinoviride]|uniref:Uncharacterized protein n=1 Tax=Trichoderma citrinoviride TaxID=58853 RepID=A0A2T4BFH8_9HYPO|nr:hypothetical protein BBK36DRAFT_1207518 [Trichoderma citrinoviride]PTB68093.1 hypothetical protein BBK36DRAFT_1207518 [Trichoderma citrinoviride]